MDIDALRQQLVRLLDGVDAHMPCAEAVADFPDDAINRRPPNVDYTPWHLLEYLRRTGTSSTTSRIRTTSSRQREVRVDADHNAYHIGEFAILRQVMGTWPDSHR